jgi:hypothetical protein
MKLRIYKTNKNFYVIQKRIFRFLLIEWWVGYSSKYGNIFKSMDEARDVIKKLQEDKRDKRYNKSKEKGTEILRFDV